MRLRNTIIVLVLAAVLGAYALYTGINLKPVETPKLFKIKAGDIESITLKYPDREIALRRGAKGKWQLLKPIAADANQSAANSLATSIADCEVKRTVEEKPGSLAAFGLDKPRVVVTVTVKKTGKLPAIEVGKTAPVGASAYIKTAAKPAVLLTGSSFQAAMIKTANDLRSHVLMAFNSGDVDRLTIRHLDGSEIEVDRNKGKWEIVKPAAYPADESTVDGILDSLSGARVADFVSDNPTDLSQYGLDFPHLAVTVTLKKKGGTESLFFGFKQPTAGKNAIYARVGGRNSVYTVESSLLSGVDKSVDALRDKTVLAFDPARVEHAVITIDGKQFTLARAKGGKWNVVEDGKTSPAHVAAVENFLDQVRNLKGKSIVEEPMTDPARYHMDKPTEQIAIYDKDGKEIGAVKLAEFGESVKTKKSSKGAMVVNSIFDYATSTASKAVYSLAQYDLSQLRQNADQFRVQPKPTPTPEASPTPSASK
jgi:Domain of unknown function (DUF4340)